MSVSATATTPRAVETRSAAGKLPIVESFEVFYEHVVRWKRVILSSDEEWRVESAEIAHRELLKALEEQRSKILNEQGAAAEEVFEQARYIMVALADETFIHLQWAGRGPWRDCLLLETRVFQSARAGVEIFDRIDRLTDPTAGRIPFAEDLAMLMLMALGLGFEGRYREAPPQGKEQLETYRRRLKALIARYRPELEDPDRPVMPQAYEYTAGGAEPQPLPNPTRWVWALAVILLGWLLISHFVWRSVIADLQPILRQILAL